MKKEEFYNTAKKISSVNGFDPLIIVSQAYHETGGFSHVIGQNNYFGIKTPSKSVWTGLTAEVRTSEDMISLAGETEMQARIRALNIFRRRIDNIVPKIADGKNYWHITLLQTFRDWPTVEEAIKWYCEFIRKTYLEAWINRSNYQMFFKALVNGKIKYATDPRYADKCISVYKDLKNKFF